MAIFRGIGGSGEANDSGTLDSVTEQAQAAASSATDAASSATDAATSATEAAASATQAATSATAAASSASSADSSATTASAEADDAATSATAAAASATSAAASATTATTAVADIDTSVTAAQTAQTAAETAQTAAETAETNAASSASSASTSATSASTSATNAATSETNAATSATNAAASETAAATSETNAATSATAAASSATSAASSATSASTAQTAAETAQAAAETAQTAAETAETNAATSATSASTSATNAATSATAAATSATSASTSATNAATSATNAATSESNAASSATSAASAQSAAEAARDSALAAYDSFDDRYLGVKTSDPSLDNDGNALIAGTLYFNSTDEKMKLYTGSSWVDAYTTGAGFLQISSNLSDLNNAATARTNLGLGTAATTASTDYATAAQGTLADSALQSSDIGVTVQGYDATIVVDADIGTTVQGYSSVLANTTASFTTADETKLDGIETGATADQTAQEIATAIDADATAEATLKSALGLGTAAYTASTAYATAAQGTLADSAVQPADNVSDLTNDAGYITGNQTITLSGDVSGSGTTAITVTVADDSHNHVISNVDGLQTALDGKQPLATVLTNTTASFTTAQETKLSGIESGATADQTASEILTAIKTVDGSGSGLDADTVDGIQASSFLRSDTDDTMTGVLTLSGSSSHITMQEDHYIFRRMDIVDEAVSNSSVCYVLLCENAANNDVNGTITMDRTSGLRHAASCDILLSAGSSLSPVGTCRSMSTGSGSPSYRLVTLVYSGTTYVALEITNPDSYYETSGAYFTGRIKTTVGSNELIFVAPASVSSVASFGYSESHEINGNTVWHSGNDGSGSGLDADTLDGVQGSSYLRSDATDTFTDLSGTSLTLGAGVKLQEATDRADLLLVQSQTSNWAGIQIDNTAAETLWSLMADDTLFGIYDDTSGAWHIQCEDGGVTRLLHAGSEKLVTSTTGVSVTGDLTVSGGDIILSGTGRIQGIDTVSASTDAASKSYVDTAVAGAGGGGGGLKKTKTTVFSSSGTWTKQTNTEYVKVQTWGGGGGGGGVRGNNSVSYATGGGGGGYAESFMTIAQSGNTQTVTVGSYGYSNVTFNNNGNGNAGGASSFGNLVSANGGNGGVYQVYNNTTAYGGNGGTGTANVGDSFTETGSTGQVLGANNNNEANVNTIYAGGAGRSLFCKAANLAYWEHRDNHAYSTFSNAGRGGDGAWYTIGNPSIHASSWGAPGRVVVYEYESI